MMKYSDVSVLCVCVCVWCKAGWGGRLGPCSRQDGFTHNGHVFFTLRCINSRIVQKAIVLNIHASDIYAESSFFILYEAYIKRIHKVMTLLFLRRMCSVRISIETWAILTDFFVLFFVSHQANAGMVSRSGHDHFLPNPFQFLIDQSFYHATLSSLASKNFIK
jgi:hypothetical protein